MCFKFTWFCSGVISLGTHQAQSRRVASMIVKNVLFSAETYIKLVSNLYNSYSAALLNK